MNRREEILKKVKDIPALPTAASRMIVLLRDPDVDISEVIKTIEFDPSLTTNVLRLANSAYFGGPRTISSLRDAIMRLGFNRIFQLVITSAILPVVRSEVKGYDLPPGALLDHAMAVAIGAEELAVQLKIKAPSSVFTAGLLHDLGKVILGTFLQVDVTPILDLAFKEGLSFEVAEGQVLGIDHAETGAALLEQWDLPTVLVDAVRWHHAPEFFTGDPTLVGLVHIADHLSISSGVGTGVDGLNYRPSQEVLNRMHMRPSIGEIVLCKMLESVAELHELIDPSSRR